MRLGNKYMKHLDPSPTYESYEDVGCEPWWYGGNNGTTRMCQNCPYPDCIHDYCNDDDHDFKVWVKTYRKELLMAIVMGGYIVPPR